MDLQNDFTNNTIIIPNYIPTEQNALDFMHRSVGASGYYRSVLRTSLIGRWHIIMAHFEPQKTVFCWSPCCCTENSKLLLCVCEISWVDFSHLHLFCLACIDINLIFNEHFKTQNNIKSARLRLYRDGHQPAIVINRKPTRPCSHNKSCHHQIPTKCVKIIIDTRRSDRKQQTKKQKKSSPHFRCASALAQTIRPAHDRWPIDIDLCEHTGSASTSCGRLSAHGFLFLAPSGIPICDISRGVGKASDLSLD